MIEHGTIQTLLGEFGRSIGLNDLAFDDTGYCVLLFDDKLVVNLEIRKAGQALLLYSLVGEPAGDLIVSYQELLRANFQANREEEAVLGMQPDGRGIVLSRWISLPGLELSQFSQALEQFVNTVEGWTDRLSRPAPTSTEVESTMPLSGIRG